MKPQQTIHSGLRAFLPAILAGFYLSAPVASAQTTGPLKVFILAGQSNMQGQGAFEQEDLEFNGTLRWAVENFPAEFGHLLDGSGNWVTRDDAWIWSRQGTAFDPNVKKTKMGGLTVGFGAENNRMGLEMGFGDVLADYFGEQVVLVKTAWGGASLAHSFRPPSAVAARGPAINSGPDGVGVYYHLMVDAYQEALDAIALQFPGREVQLSGFVWHQGWSDRQGFAISAEYRENMEDFIVDVRAEFGVPDLPFVIATTSMGDDSLFVDPPTTGEGIWALDVVKGQLAMEPKQNVNVVYARPFWRDLSVSPRQEGLHWNRNGETYYRMGSALGDAMVAILNNPESDSTPPSPDPMTFASAPTWVDRETITMTASTATDTNGVMYYFTCTSGGGNDSGWQQSPVYTDTGLTPGVTYTYTVTARDRSSSQNATAPSAGASATTPAVDTTPPTPNAMTFASAPAAVSPFGIKMVATTASDDLYGVEYYFTETSGNPGGSDSGWQSSPIYYDGGLQPGMAYTYTVTARDTSLAQVQGAASSPLSATTPASPGSSLAAGGTIWKVMDQNESQTYEGIGTRYQVSVHNDILRFASVRDGVDQPVDVTVVGTVADYRFHGQTGGVVGTVADGPANLISSLSTSSDGTITNRHNANFWTDTDPLDEWSSAFDGRDGMARVADATATVDVSGLRSGSIYFFYGGFGEAVDFSAVMEDTEAVQPDVSLGSFGALPNQSGTLWHVCSIDFVNDAGYDTITWPRMPATSASSAACWWKRPASSAAPMPTRPCQAR